jgi:hypothetical protein
MSEEKERLARELVEAVDRSTIECHVPPWNAFVYLSLMIPNEAAP